MDSHRIDSPHREIDRLDDPRLTRDLEALQQRMSPRWWYGLAEALLFGLALWMSSWSIPAAMIALALMGTVSIAGEWFFYRRAHGAAFDRTFANAGMSGPQALAVLILGVLGFTAAFLMDRVITAPMAALGVAALAALLLYLVLRSMRRGTARRVAGAAGRRMLTDSDHPQHDPFLSEHPDALRMAVLLAFVEGIQPEALRQDLALSPQESDDALTGLRSAGYVPAGDGHGDWLRLTFTGQNRLRAHLAALEPTQPAEP